MTNPSTFRLALSLSILTLLGACSGSSGSGPASAASTPTAVGGLDYLNPTGTGWRLIKDSASTSKHLLLNLVGPTGEKGRGVGFNLRSDGTVKFARFPNGTYIRDLGVFQLGNATGPVSITGDPATKDIYALVGGLKEGGRLLSVGCYQKDRRQAAQDLGQALFQVAVDFDATQTYHSGQAIPLTILRARSIPEYIGDNPDDPAFSSASVINNYRIDEVQVAVGTLIAK